MRISPDPQGSEATLLGQYLDALRATMLAKADDLDQGQLGRRQPPSQLTIAGLLYHLALVEETWFEVRFAGLADREPWAGMDWESDPDWEFRTAADLEPDELRGRYELACARSRSVVAAAAGLDQLSHSPRRDGQYFTLRWVLLHMIEETARHLGHADLIRESIDGTVGD